MLLDRHRRLLIIFLEEKVKMLWRVMEGKLGGMESGEGKTRAQATGT